MNGLAILDALVPPDALNRREPHWRREARLAALDWLDANEMPTSRDEAWRYTPVERVLAALSAAHRTNSGRPNYSSLPANRHEDRSGATGIESALALGIHPADIDVFAGDHGGPRLVFVNGTFDAHLSRRQPPVGVHAGCLSQPDCAEPPLGAPLEASRLDAFVALNDALADDGAVIRIEPNIVAATPIHIVHLSVPDPEMVSAHPATVVQLGARSQATVIETYVGIAGPGLTNASTVIHAGEGANLTYQRIQAEPADAIHVGHARMQLARGAEVHTTSISLGASISRVALDVTLAGDGAAIDIDGLYRPTGDQHHDHVITVDHAASHTRSTQRFKGIIDDRARGSFTGRIIVEAGTVDTSAHQTNRSLILRPTARSDTRPWLEILADDVRCTHGATVGRLDDRALFYLRSRGIPEPEARDMLVDAFADEIIDAIEPDSLRTHLVAMTAARRIRAEAHR